MAVILDFQFYISGLALLATSIFGIIGNLISILILQWKASKLNLNPTFSQLLSWSAVIDTVLLVLASPIFSLPLLSWEFQTKVYPILLPSLLPLGHIALTASLYTVLATSVERCLQVRKPEHANKGSFLAYILPVLVFSVIYNTPKFFEYKTVFESGEMIPSIEVQDFRKNVQYSHYVLGSNLVFLGILPFTILMICHANINRNNKFISSTEEYASTAMRRVLNTTVLVQLICRTPKSALDAYELYMALTAEEISSDHSWLVDLSHLMLVLAAASKLLILATQDGNFRTVLLGGRDRNREPPTLLGEMERFSMVYLFQGDLNIYHSDWRASPRENSLFPKISGGEDVNSVYFQSTREFRRRLPPLFVVSLGRAGDKLRGRFSSSSQCSHFACRANRSQADCRACPSPRGVTEMAS